MVIEAMFREEATRTKVGLLVGEGAAIEAAPGCSRKKVRRGGGAELQRLQQAI
jgi:hypothetical protein